MANDILTSMKNAFDLGRKSIIHFRSVFHPSKGECLPAPFHYEWDEILRNGTTNFAIEAHRESGKALALDTIVPTPFGFSTIGELKPGNFVFSVEGTPVPIIGESEIHTGRDCYELTFDDGTKVTADQHHLWVVWDKKKRRYNMLTTEFMAQNYTLGKPRLGYQEYTYRIPIAHPLVMPEKELPIDPYILGLWLGDGDSDQPQITIGNDVYEEQIKLIHWHTIKKCDYTGKVRIRLNNGMTQIMQKYNLLNNKHVPLDYFRGSFGQRLELLCGLIDSDGTVAEKGTKKGTVTFTTTSEVLKDNVLELVASLGIKVTMNSKRAKLYGKDCGIAYNVSFKTDLPVCKLQHKKERLQTPGPRCTMRSIINIKPVESVPTKCISIDHPTGMFLITPNCIATHNSQIVGREFPLYCLVYPEEGRSYIVFILATQKKAANKIKEIADEYLNDPVLSANLVRVNENNQYAFDVTVKDTTNKEIRVRFEPFGKGSAIRGLSSRDKRPDLVIIDDPQDTEDARSDTTLAADWEWFLSDVKFLGQYTRIFMIGNNLGEKCLIERVFDHADLLGFTVKRIPIFDEEGNISWPDKYSREAIEQERDAFIAMDKLDVWYRERMCVALSPDSQIFRREDFMYYRPEDIEKMNLSVYITMDLAISQKTSADYTVVLVTGVNADNHWFVLDCAYGRWDPGQQIDALFKMVAKHKPICVGVEKVGYQAALEFFLKREMPQRNIFFRIETLKAEGRKTERIAALQPRFVTHTVWFPEDQTFLIELEKELLAFTIDGIRGLHDDLVDALAYVPQLAVPPVRKNNVKNMPAAGRL